MRLDHIAVAAETLQEGVDWVEERLGVTLLEGGKHARYGTHNKLLGLQDGLYLEVIAVDPDGASMGPRWFDLDRFRGPPRVANWICAPDTLSPYLVHGMKEVALSRGALRWRMGVPPDGSLPLGGGYPSMVFWESDAPPGKTLAACDWALSQFTVRHPQAGAIEAQLEQTLSDRRVRFEVARDIQLSATFCLPDGTEVAL